MRHPANWLNIAQDTAEWLQARCGLVTASRVADVMATVKSGQPSEKRRKYQMELLKEFLTGQCAEHYVTPEMDFGKQNEPVARAQYAVNREVEIERVGFILHPHIPRSGASPDGCVGDDGLVELKVPKTETHLEYFLAGVVPEQYKPQMYWQMACAERQYCDFVSYDPRLPEEFGLLIVRLERDDAVIADMEDKVEQFIAELNAMSEKLLAHRRPIAVADKVDNSDLLPRAVIPEMA